MAILKGNLPKSISMRGAVGVLLALTPALIALSVSNAAAIPVAHAATNTNDSFTVTASDGQSRTINAVNTTRGAGLLVEYTPAWGYTTGTNPYGVEVTLEQTSVPGQYQVVAKNSIFTDPSTSGNSEIPVNGVVLSAAPGGNNGVRQFLQDNFQVGQLVTFHYAINKTTTRTANAIDPTAQSNPAGALFPGYRGPNQLIVYTPEFGASTGTNQYGYEITVENGVITSMGGDNSPIPKDGFVVSGHGTMAAWLAANSMIGERVLVNGLNITLNRNINTYISSAENTISTAQQRIQTSIQDFVNAPIQIAQSDLQSAQTQLSKAKTLAVTNDQSAYEVLQQAVKFAQQAYDEALPSRVAEARGVWYRPTETSPAAIAKTLDRMKQAGVNELYLETFYDGYTIYPSQVAKQAGITPQNPEFKGWDPLKVWVSEAAKRGIAVYAWIDGLTVGNTASGGQGPILTAHPSWGAVARDNVGATSPTPDSTGTYWLDITNPHAKQYFLSLCKEMVSKYHLAGINLDYMRYPTASNYQTTFDFSTSARMAFQSQYGVDPITLSPNGTPALWTEWETFMDTQENILEQTLYHEIKTSNPHAIVSDTPEPGAEADLIGEWSHTLDAVIPQAYSYSLSSIQQEVSAMQTNLTNNDLMFSGVFPMFERMTATQTVNQVTAANQYDLGTIVFAFDEASPLDVQALAIGPWRNPAIAPELYPIQAAKAEANLMVTDINTIYVPRKGMESTFGHVITNQLKAVINQLDSSASPSSMGISNHLTQLTEEVSKEQDQGLMKTVIANTLKRQIGEIQKIVAYWQTHQ